GRQYQVTTSFAYSPVAPATPTLKTITITVTPLGRSTALSTSTVTIITQRASLKTGPYSG
ncbi:MAG TPA: hypothetical protein VD966_09500, partial [Pyrinomonadaceae bacterium]|nr:hypothetical protein [Pyrinomonadaceae bacterium]